MKCKIKCENIQWNVDMDEVYEKLDNMTVEKAAGELELPVQTYANMTTEERHDYAYDVFHHRPGKLYDFLGLPELVEVPEEVICDCEKYDEEPAEIISDWLSDEYGYLHEGFKLKKEEKTI